MELLSSPRHTGRFSVRPFHRRDTDPMLEAVRASIDELGRWLPWAHPDYNRLDATRFIRETVRAWREQRAYDFAIRSHDRPGRHVGNVSIWFVSRTFRSGEIGYWVRSDETGRGVATEVTARMVQVGFDEMNMHRIVLRIAVGNTASEQVAHKLGFIKEGVLREELEVRGAWLDHTVYSLLEHEFRARRDSFAGLTGVG